MVVVVVSGGGGEGDGFVVAVTGEANEWIWFQNKPKADSV